LFLTCGANGEQRSTSRPPGLVPRFQRRRSGSPCRTLLARTRAPGVRQCCKRWNVPIGAGGWRCESNSLVGVLAAVQAGLGVAALMPANLEPVMACHDADALPTLPDVELGLARHPRTEGNPLIDAAETALRRMI
jgi:DNA-binding transcriptional LysR family regulator